MLPMASLGDSRGDAMPASRRRHRADDVYQLSNAGDVVTDDGTTQPPVALLREEREGATKTKRPREEAEESFWGAAER